MKHTLLNLDDSQQLAAQLVARRVELGLKPSDLADRVKEMTGSSTAVARSTVSRWESGKSPLQVKTVLTWLKALGYAGLTAYELTSWGEEEP